LPKDFFLLEEEWTCQLAGEAVGNWFCDAYCGWNCFSYQLMTIWFASTILKMPLNFSSCFVKCRKVLLANQQKDVLANQLPKLNPLIGRLGLAFLATRYMAKPIKHL